MLIIKNIRKVDFRCMFNLHCPYPRLQIESEKPSQSHDIGISSKGENFSSNWFLCSFLVGYLYWFFPCPESVPSKALFSGFLTAMVARSLFQWRKWRHQAGNSFWSIIARGLLWCFISVLSSVRSLFQWQNKYLSIGKYKLVFLQESEGVEQL